MNLQMFEIAGSFVLVLVASMAVLLPFFATGRKMNFFVKTNAAQNELIVRREQILQSIEALELDYRAEKVDESYYRETREALLAEAVVCTNKLEQIDNSAKE